MPNNFHYDRELSHPRQSGLPGAASVPDLLKQRVLLVYYRVQCMSQMVRFRTSLEISASAINLTQGSRRTERFNDQGDINETSAALADFVTQFRYSCVLECYCADVNDANG